VTDKSQPAFPTERWDITSQANYTEHGMTLRQWYAGMAMQGMCANSDISKSMDRVGLEPKEARESIVESAFKTADLMIAEGEK